MRTYKPTGRPRGRPRKLVGLTPITVYLSEELVGFVDTHRGEHSRSGFIRTTLEETKTEKGKHNE